MVLDITENLSEQSMWFAELSQTKKHLMTCLAQMGNRLILPLIYNTWDKTSSWYE